MTTIELFLKLVRRALWQTPEQLPAQLSPAMFANLMRGAREQSLMGLVADSLLHSGITLSDEQQLQLTVMTMKVRRCNAEVNKGLRLLKDTLDAQHIPFIVVKGQVAAAAYPDPSLRQAGDIDYYCSADVFPQACQAVSAAWGIDMQPPAGDNWMHIHFDHSGIVYEAHRRLVSFYGKKTDRYWQQLVDWDGGDVVTIGDMQVPTLSPELHAVYVFLHLYSHLMGLGVGLRQMCDLSVLLHQHHAHIDTAHMLSTLRTLGMERAYRAVGAILADYLGLSTGDLGFCPSATDRRYARRIFAIVRYRGNMGAYNKKSGFSGWRHNVEAAAIKLSHFAKFFPLAPAFSCRWIAYELTKKL